jgi:DNA polymerase-3 subunit chi
MSIESTQPDSCQVDFYLLGQSAPAASKLACRLALMAWERKQDIFIITSTQSAGTQLDELMWQYPEGRFLPHTAADSSDSARAPVKIGTLSGLKPTDVVINLCLEAVPAPDRFSRVLEIVPFADDEKDASRLKYKHYRKLGLKPRTHEINN